MEAEKPTPGSVIVGGFEITGVLTDKRQLRMTGHVYLDDTPKAVNDRLDVFQAAVDRQVVIADIRNKEAEIVARKAGIEAYAITFSDLVEKKNKGAKLTSVDKAKIDKYDADIHNAKRTIESLQAAIAAGRAHLNGTAPPDHHPTGTAA